MGQPEDGHLPRLAIAKLGTAKIKFERHTEFCALTLLLPDVTEGGPVPIVEMLTDDLDVLILCRIEIEFFDNMVTLLKSAAHERHVGEDWVVSLQGEQFAVTIAADREGASVTFEDGHSLRVTSDWTPGDQLAEMTIDDAPLVFKVGKISGGFRVRARGADMKVHVRNPRQAELARLMPEKLPPDTSKMLLCPMPGLVVKIDVEVGDEVQEGQNLCTIEAMKMENILRAEKKGKVSKVNAAAGDSLAVDDVIIEFE